jgi:hypothetical protein
MDDKIILTAPGRCDTSKMLSATIASRLAITGCVVAMSRLSEAANRTADSIYEISARERLDVKVNLKVNNQKNKPWYRQGLRGY